MTSRVAMFAKFFLKVTLLFLYIFNLKFKGLEAFSTAKIVLILLFPVYGGRALLLFKREVEIYPLNFYILFLVLIWSIILSFYDSSGAPSFFRELIIFFVLGLYGATAFCFLFKNRGEFLSAFFFSVLIQSILVIFSFLNPSFREFTADILVQTGNIPIDYGSRVAGFSNSSGSSLSFLLALGVFSGLLLFARSNEFIKSISYFIGSLVIATSSIFVGKLGFFVSAVFFFLILMLVGFRRPIAILSAFVCILTIFSIFYYSNTFSGLETFQYAIGRTFSIFIQGKDSTLEMLTQMVIPAVSIDTMLGYGSFGSFQDIYGSNTDIGYVRSYFSIGLPFTVAFYASFFLIILLKALSETNLVYRYMFLALVIILAVAEAKEPFIFKYVFVFYCFLSLLMARRDYSKTS